MESNESPLPEQPPLRLSILHLFLWMTGAALLTAIVPNKALPDDLPLAERVYYFGVRLSSAIAGGIPLASLALLVPSVFGRSIPFPRRPGHWILLALGLARLARIIYCIVIFPWLNLEEMEGFVRFYCSENFSECLAFLFGLAVALVMIESGGWLIVFGVTMLAGLFQLVVCFIASFAPDIMVIHVVNIVDSVVTCLFALLTVCQVVTEWKTKPRDWLHFTGVWVASFFALQAIVVLVWSAIR